MGVKKVRTKATKKEMTKTGIRKSILALDERNTFIDFVIKEACEFFFIEKQDILLGASNDQNATIRHIIMYVVKDIKPMPLKVLAYNLNLRDHTSVIHGVKKIGDIVNKPRIDKLLSKKVIDFRRIVQAKLDDRYYNEEVFFNKLLDQEAEMILNLENSHQWDYQKFNQL